MRPFWLLKADPSWKCAAQCSNSLSWEFSFKQKYCLFLSICFCARVCERKRACSTKISFRWYIDNIGSVDGWFKLWYADLFLYSVITFLRSLMHLVYHNLQVHDLLTLYNEIDVPPKRLLFKIPSTWQVSIWI